VIDARLLVPAGALWLGIALTLAWGQVASAVLAFAGLVVGAVSVVGAVRVGRGRRTPAGGPVLLGAVFALLGVAAAIALPWRLEPSPIDGWIAERATVTVVLTVTGDVRTRPAGRSGAWWAAGDQSVRATTSSWTARGQVVEARLPILLRMDAEVPVPARGAQVEVTGRLSALPEVTGLAAEVRAGAGSWALLSSPDLLAETATSMRAGLSDSLSRAPPSAASVVRGLTLGDEEGQPEELAQDMRASGLAHLMAVSGGNVAIVVGVVVGAAVLAGVPLLGRALLGGMAVLFYAYLVGLEPSVLRASVMGVIALLGVMAGGRRPGPSILGIAVLVLLLAMPWLALSWGFALSCAATAGILLVAPILMTSISRRVPRCPRLVVQAIALTVAAQVATLPILVAMGGAAGWVAVPANLAAMPFVAPVTILGLLTASVSPLAPQVGDLLGSVAAWPAGAIAWIASAAPRLPLADWPVGASWPSGWPGVLLVGLLALAALVLARLRRTRVWNGIPRVLRWSIAAVSAAMVVVLVTRPPSLRGWPPPDWLVIMCDVGQGDGLLLNAGGHAAVVVDVGVDPDAIDRCLTDAGVTTVPAVVLTHFHADHVGGLAGVTRGRSVGTVLSSPFLEPRDQSSLARKAAQEAGLMLETISAGDARRVGDVSWRALWPRRVIRSGSLPNNASVVLLAVVRDVPVLLTGDIEPEAQGALLDDVRGLDPGIVKVPHHGSRHQLRAFADLVRAPIALVSVGADNEYGHPDVETSSWYSVPGGLLLRSDEAGDVAVVANIGGGSEGTGLGVVVRDGMLPSS